ncbi:MAG: hypothetical protein K2H52_13905 [Lachnospiraceae bacterium]|nr:hypothetical protein [Lachnospiraceae bacterium]
MIYKSERIINISECEALISAARLNFEVLMDELQKEVPSKELINNLSNVVLNTLKKVEKFEFHIEVRKCDFIEDSENPKLEENQLEEDNTD